MAAITFKCPNCGGELVFDPASQKYKCEYCFSDFTQEELDEIVPSEGQEDAGYTEASADSDASSAVVYSCPSCGAQIVTEETTAATFCYYCHNPVVLSGRLSGEFLPDSIVPFSIDRESAVKRFAEFVGRKKFVPKAFWDESQIEKLSGVYYPYWIYDCQVDGELEAEARLVRVWRTGDTEYTETSQFHVQRGGVISLKDMSRNALQKSDKALVEGVMPFRLGESKKFSMGYLSGFVAEKRDISKEEFAPELRREAAEYSERILRETISGYSTVNVHNRMFHPAGEKWRYMLLPVWVLTYAGHGGHMYYYAMNGQTGTVCGQLPIDYRKLGLFSGLISAVVLLLFMVGGYLIW